MNGYLIAVVGLMLFDYGIGCLVEWLNLRHIRETVPEEFEGAYDAGAYAKSQAYLRENTRFGLLSESVLTPLYLAFILWGGFRWVDDLARTAGGGLLLTGLSFAGILLLLSTVIHLPFSIYDTFVIEEKYGFNRTNARTFVADRLKELLLTALLGGGAFAGILWFFAHAGPRAWLYSWGALVLLQLVLVYVAPVFIMPLFNKFTPLAPGELRTALEHYAAEQGFQLQDIFTMDGSKRSTKSNAYFTGFGRWRRVVLYDTLVEKHEPEELVAVLAHEVGHYRLRHVHQHLLVSVLSTGLMLYVLSLFISRPGLYEAFGLDMAPVGGEAPIYAGLVFFAFLYSPISLVLSILGNILSRRNEYAADAFAARTFGRPEALVAALKKLTVENLGNLTPHPLKVFLHYSHPPVLDRMAALRTRRLV